MKPIKFSTFILFCHSFTLFGDPDNEAIDIAVDIAVNSLEMYESCSSSCHVLPYWCLHLLLFTHHAK